VWPSPAPRRRLPPAPHDGDITAVIARIFFLLVAGVVFFVDHDQAEITHRREHSGAGPYHHAGAARADPPPLIGAFGIAESTVENGYAIAKARIEWPATAGVNAISGTSSSALRPHASAASIAFR